MKTHFFLLLLFVSVLTSCKNEASYELNSVELNTKWDKNPEVSAYISAVREMQSFVIKNGSIANGSNYDLRELGDLGRNMLSNGTIASDEKTEFALKYATIQKTEYDARLNLRKSNPELDNDNQKPLFTRYVASKLLGASDILNIKNQNKN
jgi:hypothetical protein